MGRWAHEIADCANQRVGLPVEVVSSEIGTGEELRKALQVGQIDLAIFPVSILADTWRPLALLTIPGPLDTPGEIQNVARSQDFLRAVDDLGGRKAGINVLGFGWDYLFFAVVEHAAGSDLLRPEGPPFRRWHVQLLRGPWNKHDRDSVGGGSLRTCDLVEFDGAVLSTDLAPELISKGEPIVAMWSDDYTPLTAPLAATMSTNAIDAWGEDILFKLREACAEATARFNDNEFQSAHDAMARAQKQDVSVRPYDQALWSQAAVQAFAVAAPRLDAGDLAGWLTKMTQ